MRCVSLAQKYGLVINRFCHDWELAIVFITKLFKLKMRTLLTSVQMHRRKCLEKKLIISISRDTLDSLFEHFSESNATDLVFM